MKTFFKSIDYLMVINYAFVFFCFLVFSHLEKTVLPYSAGVYVTCIAQGCSIIFTSLLYLLSFVLTGNYGLLGSQAILCLLFMLITFLYRKFKVKFRLETSAYLVAGLLGFIFLGDTARDFSLERRIICCAFTAVLSVLCLISGKAVAEKGLKQKFSFEETISIVLLLSIFGTGVCNLISPFFWRGICVFLILLCCFIYKTGITTIFSAVLGISFAVYTGNLIYISIFTVWGIIAEITVKFSRHLSGLSLLLCDYLLQAVFNVYNGYTNYELISLLSGVVLFSIIPTKPLSVIKERLYSFREKQLVRQTINRNRLMISGKLYDLSGVFTEMAGAFDAFKKNGITEDKAKSVMEQQITEHVCTECEYYARCKKNEKSKRNGLLKMIDIGFAKGRLSLIDLPKELGDICLRPNNILFSLNKSLNDFRTYALENENVNNGRNLIASQALGVAEILRGLALETGATLKYQNRIERLLADNLYKSGFSVSEILIYGEEERLTVSLITVMNEFSVSSMLAVINKTLSADMCVYEQMQISESKCYLTFKRATSYDAVYGISRAEKDGSLRSGDTHSVTRIANDRLLIALSDGMGSGTDAENISSVSLSLIESFYKAGLSSPLILNTVNKLLAINTEDSFTALDMSVIDLKTCSADFIKYGSPYGFIISDQGIKIVEGNSLPLGIIDELKPSVCTTALNDGDMILLITDGISDAFGSSGEVIDFLRTQSAKNPQTLSDEILKTAINLNGGIKKDDMTALAVRIFKRKTEFSA